MLTYIRRFHSSGRRKRIKAKLKLFLETNSLHNHKEVCQKASNSFQTKAGSSLGTFKEKLAADALDELNYQPIEVLTEKQILRTTYEVQVPCSQQNPPAYNECIGASTISVHSEKQEIEGLSILNRKLEPNNSSIESSHVFQKKGPAVTCNETNENISFDDTERIEFSKPPERGRNANILYRSQLNHFYEQRGMRRPSPRISRRVKALPHDLVCCSMVLQSNLMVKSWSNSFYALEVLIIATLVVIFATNGSA